MIEPFTYTPILNEQGDIIGTTYPDKREIIEKVEEIIFYLNEKEKKEEE